MVELLDLLTLTRFPPGFKFALMVAYFPIGVFLIVCRVLIALHAYMIVCLMPRALARRQFVRGMMGVLGIHIWVDEENSAPVPMHRVLVSNYTSVLDHIVIDVVISHFVPYHGNVHKVFQYVLGYRDLAAESKHEFLTKVKTFIQETGFPVLIQPEGVPTNNTVGLLKFSPLAFELELPVQPVSIQMSRLSFPCAFTIIESPKWTDVLWCFFTPITVFKIKTHPVMQRGIDQSLEEFSEQVRCVIADALVLEKTEFQAADVAELHKKLKNSQRQHVAKVNKMAPPASVVSSFYSNTGGSCMDSVDAELRRMIQQVKDVLPQVPVTAVKEDLEQTQNVDITITNILEGRVAYNTIGAESQVTKLSQTGSVVMDTALFKASSFSRNPSDRHLSFLDRKTAMYEVARQRYKQKHGML